MNTKNQRPAGSGVFININEQNLNQAALPTFSLFEFAFRPFFLFSLIFGSVHLLLWGLVYLGKLPIPAGSATLTPFLWHGHEMIFGYAYGVIIGFLLTAVTNWTGQKTLIRRPLTVMTLLWLLARVGFFIGGSGFILAAVADLLLSLWVLYEFTRPVVIAKNHRQWGFVSKLTLLFISNLLCYLGLFGILPNGMHQGVYLGLYLVLAIVMVMGRRVIPFFTKRALGLTEDLNNPPWLDKASLVGFTAFCIWDTFFTPQTGLAILSFALFALYALRLFNWYAKGLFKHPLIWVLWLSNVAICVAFLLKGLSVFGWVNPFLALHTFAVGGIGLITVGMMARVSLGHTGRSVFNPPKPLPLLFILMLLTLVTRVVLPMIFPNGYAIWIMLSATLWALASLLFLLIYSKILIRPRADEKAG